MQRRTVQLALVLFFVCGLTHVASGTPQGRALSLAQVEKLVQVRTPDDIVAQEVLSRGLDFTPTQKILDELQRRGAARGKLRSRRSASECPSVQPR